MIPVLIVEDEPPIMRSLKILIEKCNPHFTVTAMAANGEEAIQLLKKQCFFVVFTDICMPIKDGFQVLQYLQDHSPKTKAIILSGYEDFDYARKAIQLQVIDYLLKPINKDQLMLILNRLEKEISASLPYKEQSTENIITELESYLRSHLKEPINSTTLSKEFGFTPAYLSKLFKKERGMSPTEYLCTLRIEKAKDLMTFDPHILLKTLAPLVGFSDPFYFSKTFKKYTGMTPKEYKDQLGNHKIR